MGKFLDKKQRQELLGELKNESNNKTTQKAYKFRIYPKSEQILYFAKAFGHTRFLYNKLLAEKSEAYKSSGLSISKGQSQKRIVELKKNEEFSWLKEVHSQTLQGANHSLFRAFDRFFKKLGGYPKFKKKNRGRESFSVPQNFVVDTKNNFIKIPFLKTPIKTKFHRSLKKVVKMNSLTISRDPSGKYFASVQVEEPSKVVNRSRPQKNETGIDLGIKDFLIESNGKKVENPKHLQASEKKLKKAQKKLSRRTKGSKNRNKQRMKIARVHEKIRNQRSDFLHKESSRLIHENQVIYLEDLNVKGMMKNRRLSKAISDVGWSEFARQLKYKAGWYDCQVVQIGRFEPSSKLCSSCGWKHSELELNERSWECESCGAIHDRDVNAAKNIKKIGRDTAKLTPVERMTAVASKSKKQVSSSKQESLAS